MDGCNRKQELWYEYKDRLLAVVWKKWAQRQSPRTRKSGGKRNYATDGIMQSRNFAEQSMSTNEYRWHNLHALKSQWFPSFAL